LIHLSLTINFWTSSSFFFSASDNITGSFFWNVPLSAKVWLKWPRQFSIDDDGSSNVSSSSPLVDAASYSPSHLLFDWVAPLVGSI
jgi:hypothetical protein